MRVFVTGATGALGPHVVRALIGNGHDVSALARSTEKAGQVARMGASPVFCSLFDEAGLARAITGFDAVVNLATSIPTTPTYPFTWAWQDNHRIRTEGTRTVVDAAIAAGVPRVVQESVALWYADGGDSFLDEDSPLDLFPIAASTPVSEAHIARFSASGGTGVALRFGLFYGPGASNSAEFLALARAHVRPVFGPGRRYFSPIHLQDAASAVVAALDAPAGEYNVVDDVPVTKRDFGEAIANAVGKRPLLSGPERLVGLPGKNMSALMRSHRVSNRKFKGATGWQPRFADAAAGWVATAPLWRPNPRRSVSRILGLLLAAAMLPVGVWATFAPRAWYDNFPGFGRHWPSAEPPFSEHLITDLGGFYLAVGIAALVAAVLGRRTGLVIVGLAAAVEAVPHLAFHLIHHDHLANADAVASALVLGSQIAAGIALVTLGRQDYPSSAWADQPATTGVQ